MTDNEHAQEIKQAAVALEQALNKAGKAKLRITFREARPYCSGTDGFTADWKVQFLISRVNYL